MRLLIVRHAAAGEFDPMADDSIRELTPGGRARFARCLRQLSAREWAPARIATSPLVRCYQTAEILAEHASSPPTIERVDALAPGSNLSELIAWSNTQPEGMDLAWVGHMPDVSHLATELLGASSLSFRFRKGAILAIDFAEQVERRRGELAWLVWPKLLAEAD